MVTTPAQRHFTQAMAAKVSLATEPGQAPAGSSQYELMLAKLDTDRRRLKQIQSIERKIEVKREVLPEYQDWIAGVLSGGKGGQDDVLVTVMVWCIDVGAFAAAMPLVEYVLTHKLVMPDQYDRNIQTVVVDEIADAALKTNKEGNDFDLDVLAQVRSLTDALDMPDQARSKLYKAMGLALFDQAQYTEALERFGRALALNERSGVKRYIADCEKALSKAQSED